MIGKAILIAGIAAGAVTLGACATQSGSQSAAQPAVAKLTAPAPATQQQGQQLICTSGTPTGTHIARTTCMTAAQYQALLKQRKEDGEKLGKMFNNYCEASDRNPSCSAGTPAHASAGGGG